MTHLSPAKLDALFSIGDMAVTAHELGANGFVMATLAGQGFLIADRDGLPPIYRISDAGRMFVKLARGPINPSDTEQPVARIQREVAHHFNVPLIEMTSARRARHVARPRQVAMYLAKLLTPKSLPDIGRRFGNRDHTTVIHAIRQIENLMYCLPVFRSDVEFLRDKLQFDLCIPFVAVEMSEEDRKQDAKTGSAKLLTAMLAVAA